jgi:hypothetical protein
VFFFDKERELTMYIQERGRERRARQKERDKEKERERRGERGERREERGDRQREREREREEGEKERERERKRETKLLLNSYSPSTKELTVLGWRCLTLHELLHSVPRRSPECSPLCWIS